MENFVGSGKPLVPVCWMNANDIDKTDWKVWAHGKPTVSMPLFASPPQREWQGLTDEDKKQIEIKAGDKSEMTAWEYAQRVGEFTESKLKEKNT